MWVNGKIVIWMDLENIPIKMEPYMKDNGNKMNFMGKEY